MTLEELVDSCGMDIWDTIPVNEVDKLKSLFSTLKIRIANDEATRKKIFELIKEAPRQRAAVRYLAMKLGMKQKTVFPIVQSMSKLGLLSYIVDRHNQIIYWEVT